MCSLGMMSTWTGAWGLTSRMATVRSPVRTTTASMSPETIEQKRQPGMAEPYRGVGAEGGVDAVHLLVGDPDLPQVLLALLVGAAAAHRPDVAHRGFERVLEDRDVELRVVGEDHDRGAATDGGGLQELVRPLHDDVVGLGIALPVGEDL